MTLYTQAVYVGSSFDQTFKYLTGTSPSGMTPFDLTGWSAVFRLRDENSNILVEVRDTDSGTKSLTLGGAAGTFRPNLAASVTSGISARSGTFEIEISSGSVVAFRVIDGKVNYIRRGRRTDDGQMVIVQQTATTVTVERPWVESVQFVERGIPGARGAQPDLDNQLPTIDENPSIGTAVTAPKADRQYGLALGTRHGFMRKEDKLTHDSRMLHSYPISPSGDTTGNTDGATITALVASGVRQIVLGRGLWYVKPDTLNVRLTQGTTIRGETSGYGAGHGTIIVVVGNSGSRVIDARSTLGFRLRDLGIRIDDMRYIGDVVDLDGNNLANDSVKPIIDNINIFTQSTSATPLPVVCNTSSQPSVTVSGAASFACRPTIVIDPGGLTFSYSDSGGGAIGDVSVSDPASVDPYGTGDAQFIATGVAIPAGGSWSVPLNNRSQGLTFSFAVGTYTAGVKYRCGIGPRRLINAPSTYDGEITNCQFQFGYDGVFTSGIGMEIKRVEGNPQFTRYLVEAYVGNKLVVDGTVSKRGAFLVQCYDATVRMSSADLYDNGPWHTLDGCTRIRFDGGVMQGAGVGIAVRNGCKWIHVDANCSLQTTPVNFVSGGGANAFCKFTGVTQGASWYTGTNITALSWEALIGSTTIESYVNKPIIEGPSTHLGTMDFASPTLPNGGFRGSKLLGVQSEATTTTTVNWSSKPGWAHALTGNTTYTLVKPSDLGARGLELVIVPHATNYYTIAFASAVTIIWTRGTPPNPRPGGANIYVFGSYSGDATSALRLDWAYRKDINALGNSGAAQTIHWDHSTRASVTLTNNCTITMTAPVYQTEAPLELEVTQGAGPYAITFSPTVKTEGGAGLTLSAGAGAKDTIYLDWNGTEYRAWIRKAWA